MSGKKKDRRLTYNELIDRIMDICPTAEVHTDEDDQIVVDTGLKMGEDEDEPLELYDEESDEEEEDEDEYEDEDEEDDED